MLDVKGPPMSWYDPPDLHEICVCKGCHEAWCHDDLEYWIEQGCELCEDEKEKK